MCSLQPPKISIIVPVYNIENYLEKCLESILEQDMGEFELIAVNDGSTDKSRLILEKYAQKDSRIHLINVENGGLSWARNHGAKKAIGEYILFVDGDDFIVPGCLDKLYNYAAENFADIVIFNYRQVRDEVFGKPCDYLYHQNTLMDALTAAKLFFLSRDASIWNKLIRRELYVKENIKFPEGMIGEDLPVTFKLLCKANKIFYLNDAFYCYVQRSESISYTPVTAKKIHNYIHATDLVKEEIITLGLENELSETFDYRYIGIVTEHLRSCYSHPENFKSTEELKMATAFLEERFSKISLNRILSNRYLNFRYKRNAVRLKLGSYKYEKKVLQFLKLLAKSKN